MPLGMERDELALRILMAAGLTAQEGPFSSAR